MLLTCILIAQLGMPGRSAGDSDNAQPATQPADSILSSGDAEVDSILDRLEIKDKAVRDLRADVTHELIETFPVPETRTQIGIVLFKKIEPNPKFLVRFDKYKAGGVVRDEKHWYVFDGEWLVERQDRTKRVIKRQVVPRGQRIDVFKLGKGPFPLPFGQSRNDMLKNFQITRGSPGPGDPADADVLVCIPREESELHERFKKVLFFIDRKLELPVRIRAERRQDTTTEQVTFDKLEVNTAMPASSFEIEIPKDYLSTTEPLPHDKPVTDRKYAPTHIERPRTPRRS